MELVRLDHIVKAYSPGNRVLDGVSLSVGEREALNIRGANGSGKSTLLKILVGLTRATGGQVHIPPAVSIGYMPEAFPKELRFTPMEYLYHMGKISGLSSSYLRDRIPQLLSTFHMERSRDTRIPTFSKGMRQKVGTMQAVLAAPSLLVLDEPFSGLDSPSRTEVVQILRGLVRDGITLVFSSHEYQTADELAERAITLVNGKVLCGESDQKNKPKAIIRFQRLSRDRVEELIDEPPVQDTGESLPIRCDVAKKDEILLTLLSHGASIDYVRCQIGD